MKMTTKGKYAVAIMCELAGAGGRYEHSKDIARKHFLSRMYVEQLLNKLKKAGLVKAHKGPGGGYSLARNSGKIRVGEVIVATEGPITLGECVANGVAPACALASRCKTKKFWGDLKRAIDDLLNGTMLSDLCWGGET